MVIVLHIILTIVNICLGLVSISYPLESLMVKQVGMSDRGATIFVSLVFLYLACYDIYWIWFL